MATAFAIFIAGGNGCSLSGKSSDSSIYVDLSSLKAERPRFSLLNSSGPVYGLTTPSTASGFSCYAVNIVGPGIGESSPNGTPQDLGLVFDNLMNQRSYCSYRGVVTPPIFLSAASAEAALQVPPGNVRLVQVVGINDPLVCSSGTVNDPPGSLPGSGPRFFEVGRAVLNDVFGDQSVDVAMNWPTTTAAQAARALDCGGNCTTTDHFPPQPQPSPSPTMSYAYLSASTPMYAQKIPAVVGSYIRGVDLNLNLISAADVTVTIYQSSAGASVPGAATNYATTLAAFPATGGVPMTATFNLYQPNMGYLQMQSGYDYWIVLTTSLSSGNTSWEYQPGAGSGTAQFITSWSPMSVNAGFSYRVRECTN